MTTPKSQNLAFLSFSLVLVFTLLFSSFSLNARALSTVESLSSSSVSSVSLPASSKPVTPKPAVVTPPVNTPVSSSSKAQLPTSSVSSSSISSVLPPKISSSSISSIESSSVSMSSEISQTSSSSFVSSVAESSSSKASSSNSSSSSDSVTSSSSSNNSTTSSSVSSSSSSISSESSTSSSSSDTSSSESSSSSDVTFKLGQVGNFKNIEINKNYGLTGVKNLNIIFTELDPNETNPSLSILKKDVVVDGVLATGYEFTTNMENGSFKYDLTLPTTFGEKSEVKFSEDKGQTFVETENEKKILNDKITILNLDHFTIFVVVNPNPAGDGNQSNNNCTTATIGGSVTCYTTIQAAINAASSGDTINVAPGTYNESLTINKPLFLFGSNSLISPNAGVRLPESTITGGGTVYIASGTSGVNIRGFSFNNVNISAGTGINDLKLSKNIFSNLNKPVFGYININPGDIISTNISINDNLINPVTGGALTSAFLIWGVDGFTFAHNRVLGAPYAGIQLDSTTFANIFSNGFSNFGEHAIQIANNSDYAFILSNTFTSLSAASVSDPTQPAVAIRIYNYSNDITVINNNFSSVTKAIVGEDTSGENQTVFIDSTTNNFGSNLLQDKENKINHNCTSAKVIYPGQNTVTCDSNDNTSNNLFLQVKINGNPPASSSSSSVSSVSSISSTSNGNSSSTNNGGNSSTNNGGGSSSTNNNSSSNPDGDFVFLEISDSSSSSSSSTSSSTSSTSSVSSTSSSSFVSSISSVSSSSIGQVLGASEKQVCDINSSFPWWILILSIITAILALIFIVFRIRNGFRYVAVIVSLITGVVALIFFLARTGGCINEGPWWWLLFFAIINLVEAIITFLSREQSEDEDEDKNRK